MNTATTNSLTSRRDREVNLITAVLAVPCALACAGSVIPAVNDAVTVVLIVSAVLLVLGVLLRRVARWVRERREDRADEITAAAWRAAHPRPPGDISTVEASPGRAVRAGVA